MKKSRFNAARSRAAKLRWELSALMLSAVPLAAGAQSPAVTAGAPPSALSLTVEQAVQIGARENPRVQGMQAEARAMRDETNVMRAMTRPQVSANTYLSTGTMSSIVPGSPSIDPAGITMVPADPFADQNVTLMVPIYTGGRLRNQVRAAQGREQAALADVGTMQAETALMIRDAYYRALLAREMVRVAEARVAAGDELVRNARVQFEVGRGIEASVLRAEAERADAQRMLTSARNDEAKMILELKAAMGLSLGSDVTLTDALAFSPPQSDLTASLAEAEQGRPELLSARRRVAAAQSQVDAARGSLRPQVYGTAMADAMKQRGMSAESGYTVGVTIGLPLLDGGQRRSQIAQARSQQERAEADVRTVELATEREVRQAWLDVETGTQNYRTAQAALEAAQAAYDVIALRVQSQKSIMVEQLDALAALTQARSNLAQALYDHSIAVARLRRAVGRV